MGSSIVLALPRDILVLLPDFLHDIEDYMNLSSTCRTFRQCMDTASPNAILRLAATQSKNFFRPSPHYLVTATARDLGNWARLNDANEEEFATRIAGGIDALLDLALEHCGLTINRIRELHELRLSIINPVTDIIDKCVGEQWFNTPNYWDGGVDDACTIHAEPSETLFHLAIYGELFAPDFEPILNQDNETRRLKVVTRLEFIKYCVPDFCTDTISGRGDEVYLPDGSPDPRRLVKQSIGPYVRGEDRMYVGFVTDNNLGLTWTLKSNRWRPHWKEMRAKAGPDFQSDFDDGWWTGEGEGQDWRQRMWEDMMVCQGLEGLGMLRPGIQEDWIDKVREWREKIARLEREPETTTVGRQTTLEYPFLRGDLRICASGFVMGT